MPFRALVELDFGTEVVHAGDLIPVKLAEGVGLVDDPTYQSYELSAGRMAYVPPAKGKDAPKSRSAERPASAASADSVEVPVEDAPGTPQGNPVVPEPNPITDAETEILVQTDEPEQTKTRTRKTTAKAAQKAAPRKRTAAKKTTTAKTAKG